MVNLNQEEQNILNMPFLNEQPDLNTEMRNQIKGDL